MIERYRNTAAEALRSGKKVSAAWLQAGSSINAEILAEAGFDILLIDMEHGPGDIMNLISQIHAMKGEAAVPFVRAPWNDMVQIKRILDAGAYGIIVPYVCTKVEAEAAVKAAKFPPEGNRGIAGSTRAGHYGNNVSQYFESANSEIFVFIQIENPDGVKNLDEILSVDGVDGVFLGPMDLATTHGFRGNPDAPEVREAIALIEQKVKAKGKVLATVSSSFADAKAKYECGYNLISLMHDTVALGKVAREEVGNFQREVLGIKQK